MKQILFFTISVIFLIGCGGGSSSSSSSGMSPSQPSSDVVMEISQPYTVYAGEQVVKISENALVGIAHTEGTTESTVVLIEGEAKILR